MVTMNEDKLFEYLRTELEAISKQSHSYDATNNNTNKIRMENISKIIYEVQDVLECRHLMPSEILTGKYTAERTTKILAMFNPETLISEMVKVKATKSK